AQPHHPPSPSPTLVRSSLQGDDGPLLRGGGEPDLQLRPFGLEIILHHRQHARRAAGGGGDMEAIGRKPADHAIVTDEAVLSKQRSEEDTSEIQSREKLV